MITDREMDILLEEIRKLNEDARKQYLRDRMGDRLKRLKEKQNGIRQTQRY